MIIHKTEDDKDHPFLLACDMSECEELYDLLEWFLNQNPLAWENIGTIQHIKYKLEQITGPRPAG